jgi:hypothetical protein
MAKNTRKAEKAALDRFDSVQAEREAALDALSALDFEVDGDSVSALDALGFSDPDNREIERAAVAKIRRLARLSREVYAAGVGLPAPSETAEALETARAALETAAEALAALETALDAAGGRGEGYGPTRREAEALRGSIYGVLAVYPGGARYRDNG